MKPLKEEIQQNKPFASIEEEVYLKEDMQGFDETSVIKLLEEGVK